MNPDDLKTLTTTVASPIGPLTLTWAGGCLTGLHMQGQAHMPSGRQGWLEDAGPFREVTEQLSAYFEGELTEFDVPMYRAGTAFQRQVWDGLCRIPYGATLSYAELARSVGNPNACRAVGLANGRNPIAIIVPCHRVIAAGGALGGYGGGLERKSWLLAHEAAVNARRLSPTG